MILLNALILKTSDKTTKAGRNIYKCSSIIYILWDTIVYKLVSFFNITVFLATEYKNKALLLDLFMI